MAIETNKNWKEELIQNIKDLNCHSFCTGRRIVELLIEEDILIEIDGTYLVRFKTYIDTNI
mgnify:CR=1 FL=1